MMNFKDMGLEKFVRDYKDMNPDLLELSRELYKENKSLPDKYQLTNSQLDMEIRNNLGNAYTGLDLKNKKEALVKQEGLLQEILNGYDLVKQSIDEYSNKEKPEKDMNDKLNELATKAVQAVRDVPENTGVIKDTAKKEVEHTTEVIKSLVDSMIKKTNEESNTGDVMDTIPGMKTETLNTKLLANPVIEALKQAKRTAGFVENVATDAYGESGDVISTLEYDNVYRPSMTKKQWEAIEGKPGETKEKSYKIFLKNDRKQWENNNAN